MHNIDIKREAKKLRIKGGTVRDIAKKLGISFSTISFWCRDIKLSEAMIKKMKFNKQEKSVKGLLKYSEIKRNQRIKNTFDQKQIGAQTVSKLSDRDVLMIGLGLYWGEGYKESNDEMGFTNSNPQMVKFYLKWLKQNNIKKEDLIFRLSINEVFINQEKKIKNFWIKYLNIQENQFSKTTFIKTKLKKANMRNLTTYKGILRVKVRRGLSLKNKVLGAIEYIANQ
ncbi:MAG: helix-turn-helix domain-containing protein [Patescibacteria group bacterium]